MSGDEPLVELNFEGYWREKKKASVPAASGVYCVYTCIYSGKKQTCSPQKLLYIGASDNVRASLVEPPQQDAWESHLDVGEELCFSFAPVDPERCARCAAALIRKNKPPENDKAAILEPAPGRFVVSGAAGFLAKSFSE